MVGTLTEDYHGNFVHFFTEMGHDLNESSFIQERKLHVFRSMQTLGDIVMTHLLLQQKKGDQTYLLLLCLYWCSLRTGFSCSLQAYILCLLLSKKDIKIWQNLPILLYNVSILHGFDNTQYLTKIFLQILYPSQNILTLDCLRLFFDLGAQSENPTLNRIWHIYSSQSKHIQCFDFVTYLTRVGFIKLKYDNINTFFGYVKPTKILNSWRFKEKIYDHVRE